jgi:uncharacterized membrane protein (DUF106 family)
MHMMMTLLAQDEGMFGAFFNLRNLILLVLLIAIIVGYVMWRRRQM